MIFRSPKIWKAAVYLAAFLFCSVGSANNNSYELIQQQVTDLLLQKKKVQALQLAANYLKTDASKAFRSDAENLLIRIAKKFIFKESQEAYESSLNLTLENPKEALKSNEQCLAAEPQQLDCLIQKMRLQFRNKNMAGANATLKDIKEIVAGSRYEAWLSLLLAKRDPDFKNRQILKSTFSDKITEDNIGLYLLEIDRAFIAKNYSRVRDIMALLEKNYPEWPDLIFYRYRLNAESSEEKGKSNSEELSVYANKCKSISKSIARKFRYDFEFCQRGMEL